MHRYYGQRNVSAAANDLVLCSAECSSFTLVWTPITVRALRRIYLGKSFTWGDWCPPPHRLRNTLWLPSQGWPAGPIPSDHVMTFIEVGFLFLTTVPGLLCSFENQKRVPRRFLSALSILFPHVHFQFNNKNNILNQNLPDTLLKCIFRIYFAHILSISW